ncbi:MAG: hypothetical protein AAF585_20720 [Verrucomicrobiota bacterium]
MTFRLSVLLCIAPLAVFAQDGDTADRIASSGAAELPDATQLLLDGYEIPEMEGDDEFGEIRVIERVTNWMPWSLSAYGGATRTDNAALSSDGLEESDTYFRSGARLAYVPAIKGNLFANFGVTQEFFRYDEFSFLNFDYLIATGGLFYTPQPNGGWLDPFIQDLSVFGNYNYYRITTDDLQEEIFTNHTLSFGVQKQTPIRRGHRLYYGAVLEPSLEGNPTVGQRDEYRWFGGYIIEWTPKLSTSFTYTGSYFDYEEGDREDLNHYLALGQMLTLWQGYNGDIAWNSYVNVEMAYTINESNTDLRDYESFTWGAQLGLRLSF